jgi:hypothetical protein
VQIRFGKYLVSVDIPEEREHYMIKLNKNAKQERSLIFLHIPKAGGSTLHKIIERQYKSDTIFNIDGTRVQESIDEFKKLPEVQRGKIRVLKGHMWFGLHKYLPHPSTYITLLREPVDRMISHYYYILQEPRHYLYETVTSHRMNLKDYVCSGISAELDNGQTRLLSGIEDINVAKCSPALLESAKKNLDEHFAVIGLTERFDETLILLKRAFGWKTLFYDKEKVTRNRPRRKDVSKDTLNAIEKHNELDINLYQYVKELFEAQISQQVSFFEKELKLFKLLNNFYSHYRKVYSFPRYMVRKIHYTRFIVCGR